jgi:multiple sugar transport system substrate-binding protein
MKGNVITKNLIIIVLLLSLMVVGCGKNNNSNETDSSNTKKEAETDNKNDDKQKESNKNREVTVFVDSKDAEDGTQQKIREAFEKETGIKVKLNILPGVGQEAYKKLDIILMSGDNTDIVFLNNAVVQQKYATSGLLMPLNELLKKKGYDAESIYGKYLTKYNNELYYLPNGFGTWAVFYNKKLFDEAGVEYPKGSWTWDEYVETAKKIAKVDEGIYGSNMMNWDYFLYMLARQKEISAYKEDGTSNFDAPEFAESLKFFKELTSVHKVQPSWLDYANQKIAWNEFVNGKIGMQYFGTWFFNILNDTDTYPRDFEYGVVQPPANPGGENNIVTTGGIGINTNAKNVDEAYEYLKFVSERYYEFANVIPARVDMDDKIDVILQEMADKSNGSVSLSEIREAMFAENLGATYEKIVGVAAAQYKEIIKSEAERYLVGEIDLEQAIKNIKEKADEAIKSAQEQD